MSKRQKAGSPFVDLFGKCPVQMSIDLLREFEPKEGYYLADSFGKDSCCILQLAKEAGVNFDAHYNVTTCDPPELVYFGRKHHPETTFERPPKGKTIFTRIESVGFMSRKNRWCCREFKEHGGDGRRVVTGIRDAESANRKKRRQVEACRRTASGKVYVHAIKHWTDEMVWWFIRDRELPYCELYDQGWKRLGCVICPSDRQVERSMERWPGIWRLTERAFKRRWAKSEALQARFKDGEELWRWWISRDEPYPAIKETDA